MLHGGVVSRVDPHTGRVIATVSRGWPHADRPVVARAAGVGGVWASVVAQEVLQIDPDRDRVVARFGFPRGRGSR